MSIPGKEIIRVYDEYGPIQVFDDGNKRHLAFGTEDEQGCILKSRPHQVQYAYIRAMLLHLLFDHTPENCLILGLGSGGLAHALFHHLPSTQVTVVELRQKVIELGYSHFQLPRDDRLVLIQRDAGEYIRQSDHTETFDVIYSDIYSSEGMDQQQTEALYIQGCLARLHPDGWLVINFWQEHRKLQFLALLKTYFSQVWVNSIDSGNWILMASQNPQQLNKKQVKSAAKQLSVGFGFSFQQSAAGLQLSL